MGFTSGLYDAHPAELISYHHYVHGSEKMETALADFINIKVLGLMARSLLDGQSFPHTKKPITIFICTDGRWGSGRPNAAGVECVIKNLMGHNKELVFNQTLVMIQFIGFGHDFDDMRYLK